MKKTLFRKVTSAFVVGALAVSSAVLAFDTFNSSSMIAEAAVGTGTGSTSGPPSNEGNAGGWRNFGQNGIWQVDLSGYPEYGGDVKNFLRAVGGQNLIDTCLNYNTKTFVHTGDYGAARWPFMLSGNATGTRNASILGNLKGYATATVVVICENNPDKPTGRKGVDYRVVATKDPAQKYAASGNYSLSATVAPEIVVSGNDVKGRPIGKDPIGANNLNSQVSGASMTALGKLWNELQKDSLYSTSNSEASIDLIAKYKARFDAAIAQDAANARPTIDLNTDNQVGMAEGGVLNVSEFGVPLKVNLTSKATHYELQARSWEEWSISGIRYGSWQQAKSRGDGAWLDPKSKTLWDKRANEKDGRWTSYLNRTSHSQATQKQLGFWQMISVNCNLAEFEALQTAFKTLTVVNMQPNSGDTKGAYSIVAHTPLQGKRPTEKVLGKSNVKNHAAINRTSKLGFYDKECPYACTPSNDVSKGASEANNAVNNIGASGFNATTSKGKYGNVVLKDNVNSSALELFRDGNAVALTPDVWYPLSANGVTYNGQAPKSTIISRWAVGSPNLTTMKGANSLEEVFKATANSQGTNVTLFTTDRKGSYSAKNDQAETVALFSSETLARVPGLAKDVAVSGVWASEDKRPQVLNMKWEYNPTLTKTAPIVNIGRMSLNHGGVSFTAGQVSTRVDGICVGEFGTTATSKPVDVVKSVASNTGSGTTTKWPVSFTGNAKTDAQALVLKFIRAVGE